NASTTIQFEINRPAHYELTIYDLQGRAIAELANGFYERGNYSLKLDSETLSSGVYFYALKSKNNVLIRKMTLLK
ncbi:MAG: T9SS type A sorting domain-containing protein, partial [Fidelibacterota bacterium]